MGRKKIKNSAVLWRILIILCGLIIGINIYLANARNLLGNQMPMPFGIGAAVVLSGSMEPTLSAGDLILVKESENYRVGEVVVFQDGEDLVVHRIIAMEGTLVQTQGDANNAADSPFDVSLIKGKLLLCIPAIGNVVQLIKTPVGTISIMALAIALVEIPRRREMEKDEEECRKLIDEIKKLKDEL